MESKHWSTGYTLMTSNTKRWSKKEIERNDEIENIRIYEGFTPEDYGTGRKLVATAKTKEIASHIVKCVNSHDELVENLVRLVDRINEANCDILFPSAYNRAVECLKKVTESTPIKQ